MDEKQIHGFGWFLVSTERWKETVPWKRKFRFGVKSNIYLKPCICLKSENMNIENEGAIWNFWNLAFQNEKIDGEWTDLHIRNITFPPHRTSSPWNRKYFNLHKKPKIPAPSLTLAGGAHYATPVQQSIVFGKKFSRLFHVLAKLPLTTSRIEIDYGLPHEFLVDFRLTI